MVQRFKTFQINGSKAVLWRLGCRKLRGSICSDIDLIARWAEDLNKWLPLCSRAVLILCSSRPWSTYAVVQTLTFSSCCDWDAISTALNMFYSFRPPFWTYLGLVRSYKIILQPHQAEQRQVDFTCSLWKSLKVPVNPDLSTSMPALLYSFRMKSLH